ncbi:tRNA uridine-5-carboxymethylaminomethyl(34) synthesis GTPase MnmE [candidate division WOR-3 bacterium]|nr:tRNA uridine-5-carboxymethylaminomethyl(34) synthesis GTPase MnmE [candidate division WOR-3 bacterium]
MNPNETIVACATPPGYSSIAVVRLSGEQAVSLLQKIFRPKQNPETYQAQHVYFGSIVDPLNNDTVDTVLVATFPGPDSYTGEDVVEISCHGNPLIVDRIIRLLLELGARSARRGEFTRRALLNGKIDLIQAEAVLDTVHATCERARRLALLQYEGKLSERIYDIRSKIVDILLFLEAGIDFADEEDVDHNPEKLASDISSTVEMIDELLKGASIGMKIRNGYKILITGRANAGKSTLFNRMVGYDRAIVHEQPGTTRDFLEEGIQVGDLYVFLYDTAGILRAAAGPDEIAQQRTKALIHEADLILMMFDGSEPMNEEDVYLYNLVKHKPKLLIVNKIDLNVRLSNELILSDSIKVSARTGENVEALVESIGRTLLSGVYEQGVLLTRHRHIDGLTRARRYLVDARNADTTEKMAYELHCALDEIGELTGKVLRKEILDRIFEEFCIGK